MIVAYCAGFDVRNSVHGSAIYCPFSHIDSSYQKTMFAQLSRWFELLQWMCQDVDESAVGE